MELNEKNAFYVFDLKELKSRIHWLKSMLPKKAALCYAIKANPFLTAELTGDVERFEVCSPGEGYICRDLKIPAEMTVISGVYKTPAYIEELIADTQYPCIFTAESAEQYILLSDCAKKYGRTLKVLLRLTNDSQFGMDEEVADRIVAERGRHPEIELLGLQYFSGTQKTSLKKWKRELEYLESVLEHWNEDYEFAAEELEYGPGFPAVYFESDEINEEELIGGFSELLTPLCDKVKVTLELGRSIAYTCGKYFTHVVDKKTNKGQNYLLVDGGMHQLVYYGQYMAMKTPKMYVCGRETEDNTEQYHICGALCSMNDIIVKQKALPKTSIGDVLCFENTGAYCVTEGIALFLSRDLPAVYLKREDGTYECVRASFETRKLNQPDYGLNM